MGFVPNIIFINLIIDAIYFYKVMFRRAVAGSALLFVIYSARRVYLRQEFASGISSAGLKIITNICITDSRIIRADRLKKVEGVS